MAHTFGFFTRTDLSKGRPVRAGSRGSGKLSAERLHELECRACPLNCAKGSSPKMLPGGDKKPLVYVLGGAPALEDDTNDAHFSSEAGQLLREAIGHARLRDVRFNNTVRDYIPGGNPPSFEETECCRPSIEKDIEASKPDVILSVGQTALYWFNAPGGPTLWRGRHFPVTFGTHTCWVYPVEDPAEILKVSDDFRKDGPERLRFFKDDVRRAFHDDKRGLTPKVLTMTELEAKRRIIYSNAPGDFKQLLATFDEIVAGTGPVVIDLETRKTRPYSETSAILSISIAWDAATVSFPLDHPEARWTPEQKKKIRSALKALLLNVKRPLVAQNTPFDLEWLVYQLGRELLDLDWHDTQVQAYVLDSRKGGLKLNFLSQWHFGIKIKDESELDKEHLDRTPLTQLLPYGADDSTVERMVYLKQKKLLRRMRLMRAYQFRRKIIPGIVQTQLRGVKVDQVAAVELRDSCAEKAQKALNGLMALPSMRRFEQQYGRFNVQSNPDLAKFFHQFLKRSECVNLAGKVSTDETILRTMTDEPAARFVLTYREWEKLASTYIGPVLPDHKNPVIFPDGRLHTRFKHTDTDTARLATEDPNTQNWPKREHPEIRRIVAASDDDHLLVASDFGAIEHRGIACLSKDRRTIHALKNRLDVHLDWAQRIIHAWPRVLREHGLKKDDIKKFRSLVKNKMVFPAFFRSSQKSIAANLRVPDRVMDPLFRDFWSEYAGVRTWQDELIAFYNEHGYVENPMGFRRYGPMGPNKIVNTPVQSMAADIMLSAMMRLAERSRVEGNPDIEPCLSIHDDLTFDVRKSHLEETIEIIVTEMLAIPFSWIIVPLSVEVSVGPNWFQLKEIGKFFSDDL